MNRFITCLIFLPLFLLCNVSIIQAQVGLLSLCDDLNMSSTSTYEAEISDLSGAGTGHDQVDIVGDLDLNGTLDVLLSGYDPAITDAFEIMSFSGTLTGAFATINWPAEMIAQGWLIDYGVLNPGKVTIYVQASTLPIELVDFSVATVNGSHVLTWETAFELNNDYFEIEYRTDGSDFVTLGKVNGQGNSYETQTYSYRYAPDQNGYHYYRLKQVDFNGQYKYSEVVVIFNSIEKSFSFFPNPTTESITFNESQPGLIVYNLLGEVALSIDDYNTTFDLSGLEPGTYFLKSQGASTSMERLIKSNK